MSILNVNQIQPVGSGQTVTISATNIDTGSATVTAGTFTGNLTGNVTGNVSGIITSSSGNLTLTNGNLVFSTSGTGIDFSATSDAAGMTSEILDDYEEGTWTPGVTDGTNTGSLTAIQCRYTKIGRLVYVRGSLLNINTTGMTAGSTISVTGLPYALQPNNVNAALAFPVGTNLITTTKGVVAVVDRNSTNMVFHEVDNAVGGTTIKVSALTSGNADIYISFAYETN